MHDGSVSSKRLPHAGVTVGEELRPMVDIHCHILAGLDDGPDTLEDSLTMAEMAIADGITHVAATPHANSMFRFDPARVQRRREELQQALGDRLTITTGCDLHLSYENLQDASENPAKYTLNQKNYLLVEFANYAIPPAIEDTLHRLHLSGIQPIITHPERNGLIRSEPARLDGWLRQGCYVQVTARSLLGRFGPAAQRAAELWLETNRIHFFASDAHNASSRPPRMSDAFAVAAERVGEEAARALFHDNPLAALEGRPLPYVLEPAGTIPPPPRRKRFLFF